MINKVTLIGNLGGDPELKNYDWGNVAKLNLATYRSYQDKQGAWQKETQWHNVEIYGKLADSKTVAKLRKGDTVYVDGMIQYKEYEKEGVKKYFTSIRCETIRSLEKYESSTNAAPENNDQQSQDDLPF